MGYIYLTTNKINQKQYIGMSTKDDENYLGSGVILRKAITKHGAENFTKVILEDDIEELALLCEREIYWINHYNAAADVNFYNISEGGHKDSITNLRKGFTPNRTKLWKENMRIAKKGYRPSHDIGEWSRGRDAWNKGKTYTYEDIMGEEKADVVREKISKRLKGVLKSKIHNERNSEGVKRAYREGKFKKIKCNYCNTVTTPGNLKRWHNDNCKEYHATK